MSRHRMLASKVKLAVFIFAFFSYSVVASGGDDRPTETLSINKSGELLVNGNKNWSRTDFLQLGFVLFKDDEVYISEGILSDNDTDYYEAIICEEKPILYFEVRNGIIRLGVLLSNEVPLNIISQSLSYKIGVSLATIQETFGEIEIHSAEGQGIYATFNGLENLSFGSDCSFFPEELTEYQKKMTHKELLESCKVSSIIFFGNEGMVWQ